MLTRLSFWGIYTASYFADYLVLFVISVCQKIKEYKGLDPAPTVSFLQYCHWLDFLIWGVLIVLIIFSLICSQTLKRLPMNTRVKDSPNDNINWEAAGYVLAQVFTILTILLSDYWAIMSLVIFLIAGVIFVNSKKVHYSPLFFILMGYSIYQCDKIIAISDYSKDGLRLAIENSADGIEARELSDKVFLIRK